MDTVFFSIMRTILYSLLILGFSVHSFAQDTVIQKNNIKVIPISTFTTFNWSFGLSYERLLDAKGKLGIKLPVQLAIMNDESNADVGWRNGNRIQLNPGIMYYPFGNGRRVVYGAGLSYYYISGNSVFWDAYTPLPEYRYHFKTSGPMLNNYIGFNIDRHFNIGMEFGIGYSVIKESRNLELNRTYKEPANMIGHTNFQLGYRF